MTILVRITIYHKGTFTKPTFRTMHSVHAHEDVAGSTSAVQNATFKCKYQFIEFSSLRIPLQEKDPFTL